MKVKCISNNGAQDYLTVGKIYQAETANCPECAFLVISDQGFQIIVQDFAFEVVGEHPSEWRNDKWYPSVGSYCSLYKNPDVNRNKDDSLIHKKIKILAYDAGDVVYRVVDGKYFPIESQKDIQFIFKPFKSEKDKEIESIRNHLNEWSRSRMHTMFDSEIDNLAELLYENGFRFVEN